MCLILHFLEASGTIFVREWGYLPGIIREVVGWVSMGLGAREEAPGIAHERMPEEPLTRTVLNMPCIHEGP